MRRDTRVVWLKPRFVCHRPQLKRLISRFKRLVSDLKRHVSRLECLASSFNQHVSSLKRLIPDLKCLVSDLDRHVSCLKRHVSGLNCLISDLKRPDSSLHSLVSCLKRPVSSVHCLDESVERLKRHVTRANCPAECVIAAIFSRPQRINLIIAEARGLRTRLACPLLLVFLNIRFVLSAFLHWVIVQKLSCFPLLAPFQQGYRNYFLKSV
jgi:hypothetical protein